jgi:hypothetical protein
MGGMVLNKRGVGIILLALGVISYIIREALHYIVATSMSLKTPGFTNTMLENALMWTPPPFSIGVPIVLVILGILYLIWSELRKEKSI